MSLNSAIYAGHVVHVRLRPRQHKLRYRVFSLLLDLDELPRLAGFSKLFGVNKHRILSFWEKDHGDGRPEGLKAWVTAQLHNAGVVLAQPNIQMLCYPRMFGYVFNPLTVYFCSTTDGVLKTILYEVCNTFGEKRTYIIDASDGSETVEHSCQKELYVSPFVPMDCRYDFFIKPPADRVSIRIDEADDAGLLLRAVFAGERQALTSAALIRVLFAYPLMTLKIVGAIHWEALKLFAKGIPFLKHKTAAQKIATTIVPKTGAGHR